MNIGNDVEEPEAERPQSGWSICAACGGEFVPAFRHPQQKFCNHPQCIRRRAASRWRQSAARHRRDRRYRLKTSRRKHEEYLRRKACHPPPRHPQEPYHGPVTERNLDAFFLGLISYATGTTDAEELNRLCGRCYEIGRNVHLRL